MHNALFTHIIMLYIVLFMPRIVICVFFFLNLLVNSVIIILYIGFIYSFSYCM